MKNNIKIFENIQKGSFIERPNRFIIYCNVKGKKIRAFLPNPGRLQELLFPGSEIFLIHNDDPSRKTQYTAVGVLKENYPVMLHTHKTNTIVRILLNKKLVPGLEDTEVVKAEVPYDKSRFDFLLKKNNKDIYVEVKSCTQFGGKVAMFPDAVTERGRKHLNELSHMKEKGINNAVIFVIHYPGGKYFMPDYHTDILFSKTFLECKNNIHFIPLCIKWNEDLSLSEEVKKAEIPWDKISEEAKDRGSYMILLEVKSKKKINIGKMGEIVFEPAYYIYTGSAMANLEKRIKRHRSLRKKLHWHIDYLRQEGDLLADFPVRSSKDLECEIADKVSEISDFIIPDFGSSDCKCNSHLSGFKENPLDKKEFIKIIQYFRMDRLFEEKL